MLREADEYFRRNRKSLEVTECSAGMGMDFFSEFYDTCKNKIKIESMLEIGCSTGYNLFFMNRKYGVKGFGIEPSQEAVNYGNEIAKKQNLDIELKQGFADELPYKEGLFDMVYLGFCVYQIRRNMLFSTMSETDRVLKQGGYCVITDFDTPLQYMRKNMHNENVLTYKSDCSKFLLPYGYTLVAKKMYTHESGGFDPTIQERVSTQIFYKERVEDIYHVV